MALVSGEGIRKGLPETVGGLLAHEARQLYHLTTALEDTVGEVDAQPVIARALDRLATWRADRIVTPHATHVSEVLSTWCDASLLATVQAAWGTVLSCEAGAKIEISEAPDLVLLRQRGRGDLYLAQWEALAAKVAEKSRLDLSLAVSWDITSGALVVTAMHDFVEGRFDWAPVEFTIDDLDVLVDKTVKTRGAQYYFFAGEAMAAFDATGEHAVREGVRRFARERGRSLRAQHVEAGLPINLHTMMSDFDYGGEGIWEFDEGTLSPTAWSQDCTYCPFAEVWREFDDGLDIGYIYDMEFHVAEFSEYHSGIRVIWDSLQTRGDSVCAFRFTLNDRGL